MQTLLFKGIKAAVLVGLGFFSSSYYRQFQEGKATQSLVVNQNPELVQSPIIMGLALTAPKANANQTLINDLIEPPVRQISYSNFGILYSTYHKTPLAVYEKINKDMVEKKADRNGLDFKVEPSLEPEFQCTSAHYKKSPNGKTYDKGHMAPAANYSSNRQLIEQTFTYANAVPQTAANNRGIWKRFEDATRKLASQGKCDTVQIVSGPIYFKNNPYINEKGQTVDGVYRQNSVVLLENGVAVPEKLYKMIKCNTKSGQTYMDTFEIWNNEVKQKRPLDSYVSSVKSVENQTGLKFKFQGKLPSLVQFQKDIFSRVPSGRSSDQESSDSD